MVRLPEFVNVYVTESTSSGVKLNVLESVPLPANVIVDGLKIWHCPTPPPGVAVTVPEKSPPTSVTVQVAAASWCPPVAPVTV